MKISQNFIKHFEQIKKGETIVFVKKLRSLLYLLLQLPIYLISIPIIIVIRLIRPWFLIRWEDINSSRIGHFVLKPELYCCQLDAGIDVPSQRYIDFFYLKKYVCNRQLEKMWRRKLTILPRWLLSPLVRVNQFFNIFISSGNYHEIIKKENKEIYKDRDLHNLFEKFQPHISFTNDEEIKGKEILKKLGVPENSKFVCLNVRDSAYLDRHKETNLKSWDYHNYRDGDIDKYVLAAEELATRGYYVFRMGAKVLKPLKSSNPKVIDYAYLGMRSEFMDIYLGAKCSFCLTTGSGIDEVCRIFYRPIATITIPLALRVFYGGSEKELLITKHHIHKKNKNKLTISEIFSSNLALAFKSEDFEKSVVKLKENSPEEIRDLAIEIDERINGNWNETEEDRSLQKKFWSIFNNNIKKLNLEKTLHGKIKYRFGAKFLRENKNWIR